MECNSHCTPYKHAIFSGQRPNDLETSRNRSKKGVVRVYFRSRAGCTQNDLRYRPVFFVVGALIVILAAAMMVPISVDLTVGNPDWMVFAIASAMTLLFGVQVMLTNGLRGAG